MPYWSLILPRTACAALVLAVAACGDGARATDRDVSDRTLAADTALQRLAGELLPAMETISGLPARAPVRLAARSRGELEEFLIQEIGRQLPPERVSAIVRAYARFGLVPDTLELEPLLRALFLEQVVGYYDPRSDTLFVVEGVPPGQVEAVLAHEIVHALQDQYMDLDSVMEATLEQNDRGSAARAALEGHATYAMLEWQLGQVTGEAADLTALPSLDALLGDDPLAAAGLDMPILRQAPAVIRESLLFPYLAGLVFMQRYWRGVAGRPPPLGADMPVSTEQVIHPDRFLPASRDLPVEVRFTAPAPDGWSEVLTDALGELETRVLLREFLPDQTRADRAAAGWDGDAYRLLESEAGEWLVWVSAWDTPRDADEFASAVAEALEARYGGAGAEGESGRMVAVERESAAGRPVVVVQDAPAEQAVPEPVRAYELRDE